MTKTLSKEVDCPYYKSTIKENGTVKIHAPGTAPVVCNEVDIGKICDRCGWNPTVAEERTKKIVEKSEKKKVNRANRPCKRCTRKRNCTTQCEKFKEWLKNI